MIETQSISVLDAIKEYADFHTSVFFSYGADLAFYEEAFLRPFWQNNCKNNLVFIDSERYRDTTSDWRDSANWVGKRYLLTPIRFSGLLSFHSKLLLLLGKERARLLLGSGNLTFTGIGVNHEVFTCLDWTEQHGVHLQIFQQVWQLIGRVQDQLGHSDQARLMYDKASSNSDWLLASSETKSNIQFLHNLDELLMDLCARALSSEKIHEITILSPFLDFRAKALREMFVRFKPRHLKLVLQNHNCSGDLELLEKLQTSGFPLRIHLFSEESNYLHAKIYLFKTDRYTYILTGSANCSDAAWLHPCGQGNFETLLLAKVDDTGYAEKLFNAKVDLQPVSSLEMIKLAERKPLVFRKGYAIDLLSVILSGSSLTVVFNRHQETPASLGLEISAIPITRFQLGIFPPGNRNFRWLFQVCNSSKSNKNRWWLIFFKITIIGWILKR